MPRDLTASGCIATETASAADWASCRRGTGGKVEIMVLGTTPGVASPPEAIIAEALGRRSIVLVGMMGSGKSSIGRRVALRLGMPFVDADMEIEKAAGMTIADIFSIRGEAEF